MEQMRTIVQASAVYRALAALCLWFGGQWRGSGLIQWFIHPPLQLERAESDHSVFARLWQWVHGGLCRLYQALRLDRLFEGSIFQKCWLWAGAAAVLAPIIPTMAVLGLVLVSAFSLLLNLMKDSGRKLYYAPMNRYLWLYAAIYLAGTWFSVTRAGSLLGGVLTVAFILFAIILENSITTRRQLDTLLLLLVMAGTAVALYGICQYLFGWGYQSAAWADSEMFGDVFRVPSTLENPNMLGQYLILAIPLGGAGLLAAKDWGMRVFYFCCCGVMCVCMLLTLSRGAWLGLLFAGFVFVLFLQPRLLLLTPLLLVALYFILPDGDQPLCQHRESGGQLHLLPGVYLDGNPGYAEGLLDVRHRPGGRGLQSGVSQVQLQRHRGPPRPQSVPSDRVRRGGGGPGGVRPAAVPLFPGPVRRLLPGEGPIQPPVSDGGSQRDRRLPGPGDDGLLLL